jgi:hypothetical protein
MMPDIAINPSTKVELEAFIEHKSHALGMVGENGLGKNFIASWLLEQYLAGFGSSISNYPYLKVISDNKGSISIDDIRELRTFLKLKTLGDLPLRRFVVIDHADNLTLEAQNALLKTLEDPPADTLLILLLNNERSVLETIRSRLQLIHLKRPSRDDVLRVFGQQEYSKSDLERAYLMSSGLVGLMDSYLKTEDSDMAVIVGQAKQILKSNQFERINMIDSIYKDKQNCQNLLKMLIQMSQSGLEATAERKDDRAMLRWQSVISAAYRAEEALTKNAQPKLVLTDLMLSF